MSTKVIILTNSKYNANITDINRKQKLMSPETYTQAIDSDHNSRVAEVVGEARTNNELITELGNSATIGLIDLDTKSSTIDRYSLEAAIEEGDKIKDYKTWPGNEDADYNDLSKKAETSILIEKIREPEYDQLIIAETNETPFTESQKAEIDKQIVRLEDRTKCQFVIDQLRKEGVENSNILLLLQKAWDINSLNPVLHRVEMFSDKSREMRKALGIDIDDSDRPEKYLYHGIKSTMPKLSDEELQSFIDNGIICGQRGVSTIVGEKGLATTIVGGFGYGEKDMFRIDYDRLVSDGFELVHYKPDSSGSVQIDVRIDRDDNIPPEYVEYRINSLGIYVPLARAMEIQKMVEKIDRGEMSIADITHIDKQ